MGRTLGIVLIIGGFIVSIILALLMFAYVGDGSLGVGAAMLGFAIGFLVLVLPQWGFGIYFLIQGRTEAATAETATHQRELLGMVKAQGQVPISDISIELKMDRDDVHTMIYDLVNMGLFTGYINWDKGVLYSTQASELRNLTNCRNCGGQLELAGSGVIACPYCGTEYFLN